MSFSINPSAPRSVADAHRQRLLSNPNALMQGNNTPTVKTRSASGQSMGQASSQARSSQGWQSSTRRMSINIIKDLLNEELFPMALPEERWDAAALWCALTQDGHASCPDDPHHQRVLTMLHTAVEAQFVGPEIMLTAHFPAVFAEGINAEKQSMVGQRYEGLVQRMRTTGICASAVSKTNSLLRRMRQEGSLVASLYPKCLSPEPKLDQQCSRAGLWQQLQRFTLPYSATSFPLPADACLVTDQREASPRLFLSLRDLASGTSKLYCSFAEWQQDQHRSSSLFINQYLRCLMVLARDAEAVSLKQSTRL